MAVFGTLFQSHKARNMITFVVQKRRGGNKRNIEQLAVFLQLDLQEFLGTANKLPAIARLSELDSYEDEDIEGEWLEGLIRDLGALLRMMQENTITLHVPEEVGSTSDEDLREKFGREGLFKWATNLLQLSKLAMERSVPLQAAGD